jgi:hypothetical protein
MYGDVCSRVLFPKRPSPERLKIAALLVKALRASYSDPDPTIAAAAKVTVASILSSTPAKLEGLRVDCIMQLRHSLLWIDVGIVHPTSASKLAAVKTFVTQLYNAEKVADGNHALNSLAQVSSPPVVTYGNVKKAKYFPLIEDTLTQVKNGQRAMAPTLVPCIFSHSGEMSPESLRVVELITREYTAMTALLYFEDGVSLKHRSAAFRTRFKDALMVANANGFGATLAHAGRSRNGQSLSPADAYGGLPGWEVVY